MKRTNLTMIVTALAVGAFIGCGSATVEPRDGRKGPSEKQRKDGKKGPGESPRKERPLAFDVLDADGDGFATSEEINQAFFEKMDANGDDKITKEERDTMKPRQDGRGTGKGKRARNNDGNRKRDKRGADGEGRKQPRPEKEERASFEECDTNGDGFITFDEFKAADNMLRRADANDDGKISAEEYEDSGRGRDSKGPGKGPGKKHDKDNR